MFDQSIGFGHGNARPSQQDTAIDIVIELSSSDATHPRSAAELVWDGLARDEVTAVWSSTEAGWPLAGQEDTVVLHAYDDDAANEAPVADEPPVVAQDTEVAPEPEAALVLLLAAGGYPGDGMPVAVHLIVRDGWVDVGSECAGPWHDDAYLDPWHVRFTSAAGGVRVQDSGSRGGVWMRLGGGRWLLDGDRFRLGTQFLRYDAVDHRVQLVVEDEPVGAALRIDGEIVLGREAADATFPHDPYVSAHHCCLVGVEDGVWLEDLASSNGTWVRVRSGEVLPFGSVIAMGSALYRIESGEP